MTLASYSDVFQLEHDRPWEEDIRVGDVVRLGANHFPNFTVIAVDGEKAWVRDTQTSEDGLALLRRCRRV